MKRYFLYIVFLFMCSNSTYAETIIKASELNKRSVNSKPYYNLSKKIKLILDEDLLLSNVKKIFAADKNKLAQLIIYSAYKHRFIIAKKVALILRQILQVNAPIIVSGNAQLVIEEGSTVVFDNNDIIVKDNAMLIFNQTVS